MAIYTGTQTTYAIKGIREELSDVIYNISPIDTPFISNAGRGSVSAVASDWQIDTLASPDGANAQLEGDDIASGGTVAAATTRVQNICQISRKLALVDGTTEAVTKAGRKREMSYQIGKRGKELKRDIETIVLSNQAAVAGNTTTARTTAGLPAWMRTNTSRGATGANPAAPNLAPLAAATDGTQRTFTEALLTSILNTGFTNGMAVDGMTLMLGVSQKATFSTFTGIATKTYYTSAPKVAATIASSDVYVGDYGTLSVTPNRFQRSRDGWLIDWDYVEIAYLRKMQTQDLSKTGDADKKMLIAEYMLKVKNEGALAVIADLT